jgi:hypothetical protein
VFVLDRGPAAGVGGLSAIRDGNEVDVSGWATFSGTVATSSLDGAGDAFQGGDAAGADFTNAEVVYRPESEDLLVRLSVTALPSARPPQASGLAITCALGFTCGAGAAGAPAVTYVTRLAVDGTRFEIRAERGASPAAASIHLLECDAVCTPLQTLAGSIGVTGDEVVVAVPLAAIDAGPGDTIRDIGVSAGPGHPVLGAATALDQVSLPDAVLPAPTLTIQPKPADGGAAETFATLSAGRFSARIPVSADVDHVLARACLGQECGWTIASIAG